MLTKFQCVLLHVRSTLSLGKPQIRSFFVRRVLVFMAQEIAQRIIHMLEYFRLYLRRQRQFSRRFAIKPSVAGSTRTKKE